MKARLIIAMAIGALISMIFLAIPSLRNGTSAWAFLELPGMIAVLLAGPVRHLVLGSCVGRECSRLQPSCLGGSRYSQNFKLTHYRWACGKPGYGLVYNPVKNHRI
jgi:hypothetical protein